jgi:hypothetical protein
MGGETMSDEGVVRAVLGNEVIIQRDNGSQLTVRVDQQMTMPSEGQRVKVQYRLEGTQPIAESIDNVSE